MGRSVRVNLLVTPEEKQAIDRMAETAGSSVSEVIRQAVDRYDPNHDVVEIAALADVLASAVRRMSARLEATEARLGVFEKQMGDRPELRKQVLAELEKSGEVWPFALPALEDSAA